MKRSRQTIGADIVLTLVLMLVAGLAAYAGAFDYLNMKLFDMMSTVRHERPEHRDNVVIVAIDQGSIDFFDANMDIRWPWPREYHGRLVRHLDACGARAVGFDVIFSERDHDLIASNAVYSDEQFAAAMEESRRVYLAAAGKAGNDAVRDHEAADMLDYIRPLDGARDAPHPDAYRSLLLPYRPFCGPAAGIGVASLTPDRDGIHRRYPLFVDVDGVPVPSFAAAILRGVMGEHAFRDTMHRLTGTPGTVDDEGKILLQFYGRGGVGDEGTPAVFDYYSYHAVIMSSIQQEMGETPVIPPETFRDKIVLVGANAAGLLDFKATPFTHLAVYPGIEIHATAIENMLDGDFHVRLGFLHVLGLVAAGTAVIFIATSLGRHIWISIPVYAAVVAGILAFTHVQVMSDRWLPAFDLVAVYTAVFAGLFVAGYIRENREKLMLRRTFERYVNKSVLADIIENPASVDFEGKDIRATIMATDIAGFTTISEKLGAHEVVSRLNDYLSEVSETLIDNGAFINKYIGDAILAVYGAFGEADHPYHGCAAALEARSVIERQITEAENAGMLPFVTRIGITTGEMTMGNIGSERKLEYTVIGDAVNTAFRLEGLNKFYHTRIIVNGTTRDLLGDAFEFRLLDTIRPKGKEIPQHIYELLGYAGKVPGAVLERRDRFEAALEQYRSREFGAALGEFRRLEQEGDETAGVFVGRCEKFMAEPLPPDWNGVWVMLRK